MNDSYRLSVYLDTFNVLLEEVELFLQLLKLLLTEPETQINMTACEKLSGSFHDIIIL